MNETYSAWVCPREVLLEVGLPYSSLGQPLSTFSGGERQRVKLAQNIKKKGKTTKEMGNGIT